MENSVAPGASHHRPRHELAVLIAVLFATACLLAWGWLDRTKATDVKTSAQPSVEVIAEEPASLESKIMFVGDMYWGRSTHKSAQASPLKEAYPFARLNEFGRENYDAWIGNMECPSVPGVVQPYSLEAEKLLFNCPSSYLPELAKWFTAVSLANNHTANQKGQTGLDATRTALEEQKIQYFGHYDPRVLEDVCEVIALPARLKSSKTEKDVKVPIALCGYHGLAIEPPADSLAVMQQYAKVMPVVAYPHMGAEYKATADSTRRRIYQSMIDNGADMVLAAHPHWVQPAEVYKDKLIVYSMGNFIFDQEPGETRRGAAITLTLNVPERAVSAKALTEWIDVGNVCGTFRDDCLSKIGRQAMERLPFELSFGAMGVNLNGKQTHPADQKLNDDTLERLNWATAMQQLQ